MAFCTIRTERQFCEQLCNNLLFKWFLDLNVEDEPFHPTTFTKNRERLMDADAARFYRNGKQQGAQLRYLDHVLTETRNLLVVDVELTEANPWSSQGQADMPNARRHWRCWSALACLALDAGSADRPRWAPTVAATRATSSGTCAVWGVPPHSLPPT